MKFLKDPAVRQWIYGVAAALLVLLGGYGIIDEAQSANILGVVSSVLIVGAAPVFGLAARKAEVVSSDIPEPGEEGEPDLTNLPEGYDVENPPLPSDEGNDHNYNIPVVADEEEDTSKPNDDEYYGEFTPVEDQPRAVSFN